MRQSIELLIEKYKNNLYAIAFNVCKNAYDAEDVVQDTFIQYISQRKEYDNEQHLRAWLIRVAINMAKNKSTAFFRRNALPLEDYAESLSFETPEASELFLAVMALPESYRVVIHLYYYEDYTVSEIAKILRLSESNVKVRLSRGRNMLKDTLKEAWDDE